MHILNVSRIKAKVLKYLKSKKKNVKLLSLEEAE